MKSRFFNTAGPVNPEKHYFLPRKIQTDEIEQYVEREYYFIFHAPRQTGKTTAILAYVHKLNREGKYKALYVNVEGAQAQRGNVVEASATILSSFRDRIEETFTAADPAVPYLDELLKTRSAHGGSIQSFLRFWAKNSEKPIVLFIDEVDSLVGDTLISLLRQLRSGYSDRPSSFPQSICFVGVRDVRDYRIWSDEKNSMVLGGSAFNIKAESIRLSDFSKKEVKELYGEHTKETGQKFAKEAIDYAFDQTQGQPWLVNALAYQACFRDVQDRKKTITRETLERAKEALILRRDTHLDVLIDRLQEPRVRAVIDTIISGAGFEQDIPMDDLQYVRDLGLISAKGIHIANPIYQEVIPRELIYTKQEALEEKLIWYLRKNKTLDMNKVLLRFTQFYRENSDVWLEKFSYKEAGPHLLLMAYLQRIVNGGARIHREYALGRGRVDLLVEYGKQRIVIELKVLHRPQAIPLGLKQTAAYMRTSSATEGHLIVFDRTPDRPWDEKVFSRKEKVGAHSITLWGM